MTTFSDALDDALTRRDLLPSLRSLAWVLLLFVLAILLARSYATPIGAALSQHERIGMLLFVGTTALAVVLPLFSNLPLVPFAVLLWGPWGTALLITAGWIAGAALSFSVGRHLRPAVLRAFPQAARYARIDDLIHPRSRLLSLAMLRMTFPMDILSYALGLFSRRTTAFENALSTAIGGAPFAVLFGFFPALPLELQLLVFLGCVAVFGAYVKCVVRSHPDHVSVDRS